MTHLCEPDFRSPYGRRHCEVFFLGKIFVNKDDKLTKREKHLHTHMITLLHEEGKRAYKTCSHSRKRGAMPRQQGRGWGVCRRGVGRDALT